MEAPIAQNETVPETIPEGWVGTAEAAAILGLTPQRVQQLAESGKLSSRKVQSGRRQLRVVSLASIEERLETTGRPKRSDGVDLEFELIAARQRERELEAELAGLRAELGHEKEEIARLRATIKMLLTALRTASGVET